MKYADTLCLVLTGKWFNKIASGRKRFEFREASPHWQKRLEGKTFKYVRFQLGYHKNAKVLILRFVSIQKRRYKGKEYYCIELGDLAGFAF